MQIRRSILIAIIAATVAGSISLMMRQAYGAGAADLSWPLHGMRDLARGVNPYGETYQHTMTILGQTKTFYDVLLYPLPALVALAPLTPLSDTLAGAAFCAVGVGILAYAVLRRAPALWPLLLSPPVWDCLFYSQWGALLTALVMLPAARPVAVALKPTYALVALALAETWRERARIVVLAGAAWALCLLLLPSWPLDWLRNTSHAALPRTAVALLPAGLAVWLVIGRWRAREGRVLLAQSLSPHLLGAYDHGALFLSLRTTRSALVLALLWWFVARYLWSVPDLGTPALYTVALGLGYLEEFSARRAKNNTTRMSTRSAAALCAAVGDDSAR